MTFREEIRGYLKAGFPTLWVQTHEEIRSESELKTLAADEKMNFWRWSVTQGWIGGGEEKTQVVTDPKLALAQVLALPQESVLVLRDFHPFLSNPQVVRALRDLIPVLKGTGRLLIVQSPVVNIPTEIEKEVTVVKFSLPTRAELKVKLDAVVEEVGKGKKVAIEDETSLLDAASGLTLEEAENAFSLAWVRSADEKGNKKFDDRAVTVVRNEKAGAVKKSNVVEWIDTNVDIDSVGGLANLKADLKIVASVFHDPDGAKEFGFKDEDFPRTIAIVGVPGTGKSLTAEAISKLLGVGCVRTDAGKIFSSGGGRVGAAEGAIEEHHKLVAAMAPVVDWHDEFEKGAGGSGAAGKSEANPWEARVGASLLTWLESFRERILVVATINRTELLPPEMFSRFQRVYFVDLPVEEERTEIFNIHLTARKIKLESKQVLALAIKSQGFNGREIRNAVQAAMQTAFAAGETSVSYERLVAALGTITPLSIARASEVNAIREWAKINKIRPASSYAEKKQAAAESSGERRIKA